MHTYFLFQSFGHLGVSLTDKTGPDFLTSLKFPILCANLDNKDLKNVVPSSTVKVGENKEHTIGLIGYYTPHKETSKYFLNETELIQIEAKKLRESGAKTIIAFGHADKTRENNFGEIEDVDIFIGCHLYKQGKDKKPVGKIYPVWIWEGDKKVFKTIDVKGSGKYVTRLDLIVDSESGAILKFKGEIIDSLSKLIEERFIKISEPTRPNLEITLNAGDCNRGECNFGNLITDAMIHKVAQNYTGPHWTNSAVAFIHADMIKSRVRSSSYMYKSDIEYAIPKRHQMVQVTLPGKTLKKVIEAPLKNFSSDGQEFLQYSGVIIDVDRRDKKNVTVKEILLRCAECRVPRLEKLNKKKKYKVLCPDVLANGSYGYDMIKKDGKDVTPIGEDLDIIWDFFEDRKWVWYFNERRIQQAGRGVYVYIRYILIIYAFTIYYLII